MLRALQQINPPKDVTRFDPLRDYPRSEYNDITRGKVDPAGTEVVVAHFGLDDGDKAAAGEEFRAGTYVITRRLDNSYQREILGAPPSPTLGAIRKDLIRMAAHLDSRKPQSSPTAADQVEAITKGWQDNRYVQVKLASGLKAWVQGRLADIDEDDEKE